MNRIRLCAISLICVMVFTVESRADIIDLTGAGFNIPDNNPAGITSTITLSANESISDVDVILSNLQHSWLGDLTARITSPSGTTADLFVRVGSGFFGDSSNLNGDYTFSDGGASFTGAAGSIGGAAAVPSGTYGAETNGGVTISLATAFAGESTSGVWTLFMSDSARFDSGSLGGWGLNITSSGPQATIPEPSSFLLFGLAGLVSLRRRRREDDVCERTSGAASTSV